MLGVRVKGLTRPRRVFYGWWMALSGMIVMAYSTGIGFHGFSAFFDHIVQEMRWSRATVSIGPSIQSLETGFFGPIVGFMTDRLGPRLVLVGGFAIGGVGFILLGQVHALWQFYAAFLLIGLGMGVGSYVVVVTAITNWFIRQRGKALGLALLGPGLAGAVTFAVVGVIEAFGWRVAAVVVGVGMWIIGIPLSLIMRRRPEEYGLRPDGDPAPAAEGSVSAGGRTAPPREAAFTVRAVLRARSYWFYVIAVGLQQIAISALVVHHIPALKAFGLTTAMAGFMVLVFTIASLPARYLSGYLSDRFDKKAVLVGALCLQLLGGVLFLAVTNFWTALVFEVIYGSGWGASNPARLSLQGEYWGRGIFGSLLGLQMGAGALGGLAAPVFVGWMYDVTHSYRLPFVFILIPLVLSILVVLMMRRPMAQPAFRAEGTGR